MTISLCVITLNEEAAIERCLQSARGVADEILVLDSGSDDKTVDLAGNHGALVVRQPWLGFVGQKNKAIELASHDWVLSLDADEELSPQLKRELLSIKNTQPPAALAGFSMPRCVLYEGRWIRHGDWYPDRLVRLFRKSAGRFAGGKVHERLELTGSVTPLAGDIIHHSFKDARDHWDRCQKYARLWAESAAENGKTARSFSGPAHAFHRFFRAYFLRLGFLDGALGFRIAKFAAAEVALKYRLLNEIRSASKSPPN